MANLGVPAWTALQADLIPRSIRGGQYYANRSVVLNVCALAATFAANFCCAWTFLKLHPYFQRSHGAGYCRNLHLFSHSLCSG